MQPEKHSKDEQGGEECAKQRIPEYHCHEVYLVAATLDEDIGYSLGYRLQDGESSNHRAEYSNFGITKAED